MIRPVAAALALSAALVASAAAQTPKVAPEFPPGLFSDGGSYSMADFEGKVLTLIFYESKCPTCAKAVPEYGQLARTFAGEPVYVLAVAAEDSANETQQYMARTGMDVPVFVDHVGLFSDAYDFDISLNNIRQIVVIDGNGNVRRAGFKPEGAVEVIRAALPTAKWKYDPSQYPAMFGPMLQRAELGDWPLVLRELKRLERAKDEETTAAAAKLLAAAEAEADAWLAEAKELASAEKPAQAYAVYEQVAMRFPLLTDRATTAREAGERLEKDEAVQRELAARREYDVFRRQVAGAGPDVIEGVKQAAAQIAAAYEGTPTSEQIRAWLGTSR